MRTPRLLLIIVYLLCCHIARSIAAPVQATSQILLGEIDITLRDDNYSDVTTEEPFTKKCIVDGNAYSHSQTIPSYDTNSHCLCVAGEVYCWWQNFHPNNVPSLGSSSPRSITIENGYTLFPKVSTIITDNFEASGDSAHELPMVQLGYIEINSTSYSATHPIPTTCLVMGREYRQGEILPHSTGNCVECSCGTEGRVECSPKDCVALRPEILVAPDIPETSDNDFSEVFNLARDRGIDENF